MQTLIFLSNKLQNPSEYKFLNLPLEFIAFGITEGKMYSHFRNRGVFVAPADTRVRWGNSVVYGGLFHVPDVEFYLRILDAYHENSMSSLGKNHYYDTHHRHLYNVTPIYFNTLDELARLQYKEGRGTPAHLYMGNLQHPKIARRVNETKKSYRIVSGIDVQNFTKLFGEVTT